MSFFKEIENSEVYKTLKEISTDNKSILDNITDDCKYYNTDKLEINIQNLNYIFKTLTFFLLEELPYVVYVYMHKIKENSLDIEIDENQYENKLIREITFLFFKHPLMLFEYAINNKNFKLLKFLHDYNYRFDIDKLEVNIDNLNYILKMQSFIELEEFSYNVYVYMHKIKKIKEIFVDIEIENKFENKPFRQLISMFFNNDLKLFQFAIDNKYFKLLKFLHDYNYCYDLNPCKYAAQIGCFETIKFLHEICESKWDFSTNILESEISYYASKYGNLELLEYVNKNGCPIFITSCIVALEHNHSDCLVYAYKNLYDKKLRIPTYKKDNMVKIAVVNGDLNSLKFLHENNFKINNSVCEFIANTNNLELLKWIHQKNFRIHPNTCAIAALNNNLEMIQYAHENKCSWDTNTCANAALKNNIEILRYAHTNGCPWDAKTCAFAAQQNNFEILQYAHENGCPWDADTCSNAAFNGNLQILKYAFENGCPWNSKTTYNAKIKNNLECFTYACNNGCLECLTYEFNNNFLQVK